MNPPLLRPLASALRHIPEPVHEEIFCALCNQMLRGQPLGEQLFDLEGKIIALGILDSGKQLHFRIHQRQLQRAPGGGHWDARIAAELEVWWRLAIRADDPDTLFFQRRLVLEGETETALYIKNMLDALEFDWRAHLHAVLGEQRSRPLITLFARFFEVRGSRFEVRGSRL